MEGIIPPLPTPFREDGGLDLGLLSDFVAHLAGAPLAGFLALGIGLATGVPAVVLTTSGTAAVAGALSAPSSAPKMSYTPTKSESTTSAAVITRPASNGQVNSRPLASLGRGSAAGGSSGG